MKPYETRLLRAQLVGLAEDEVHWALMEPAWMDEGAGTPGQQALARATYFLRDFENGGLSQALWNRDAAQVARIVDDLHRLGSVAQSAIVSAAERAAFNDMPSPRDLGARRELLDAVGMRPLDQRLAAFDADLGGEAALTPFVRAYIDLHPDEFSATDASISQAAHPHSPTRDDPPTQWRCHGTCALQR